MINKSHTQKKLETVQDLVCIAGQQPPSTVVVVGGDRVEDLQLVESAQDHGIVEKIILVGQKNRINKALSSTSVKIPTQDILAADDDEHIAAITVELIKAGKVDIVLKGNISTPIINRHMLKIAVQPTVSLVTIFDADTISNGRPIIMTDAGVTTVCNFGRLVDMIRNSVDVAQDVMGIPRPRVAILSANEKQIQSLPSTGIALKLSQRNWPDAVVYGPLSFDLATDPKSVLVKGLPNHPAAKEVAGQADILVCPGIDSANILYKTIASMNKYGIASLANMTIGFPVPYIILSRSDIVDTRLNSIALCSVYMNRTRIRQKKKSSPLIVAAQPAKAYRVLVVNPGSTSIKLAVFENDRCLQDSEMPYDSHLTSDPTQRDIKIQTLTKIVTQFFQQQGGKKIDAIAARGGFLPRSHTKLPGGTYVVAESRSGQIIINKDILTAILDYPEKKHASNFGVPVAAALAKQLNVPAYIVDPVVVDEFSPHAELSGYAPITRRSTSHALSIRAAAKRAAQEIGRPLEDIKLVVAHLGGGITIAAVCNGKMIDNTIALLGGGPFTPQRAGQLPTGDLIDLCYYGKYTRDQLIDELTKHGGLQSYLGQHRMEIIAQQIEKGDKYASLIVDAMVYQIAKEIGSAFVAADCDVEAIVLTGGLVRSKLIRSALRSRINSLAPVIIFEESLEMPALAAGVLDILSGRCKPHYYKLPSTLEKRTVKNE